MRHLYRKVTVIEYNEKVFQVFRDERGRYAFLRIGEDNKFHYPILEDLVGLIEIFSRKQKGVAFFENEVKPRLEKREEKRKKIGKFRNFYYKVALGVLVGGSVCALTAEISNRIAKEVSNDVGYSVEEIQSSMAASDDEVYTGSYGNRDITDTTDVYENEEEYEVQEIEVAESLVDLSNGYQMPTTWEGTSGRFDEKQVEHYSEHQTIIKDTTALNKYLGYKDVSYDKIEQAINENYSIPAEYKPIIKDFAKEMMDYYPGIEMRIFYENIKKMEIKYVEDSQDQAEAQIEGVEAWYNYCQNNLYVSKKLNLVEGSHDMIVFRHELGHALNTARIFSKDQILMCSLETLNYGHYIQEGANVMVTAYPFESRYGNQNLGLPLVSNELRVILEATPGFDPRQLVSQNIEYLEDFLDENNQCEISAQQLFDLMEIQSTEYYDGRFKGNKEDYAKIYKYIADVYIANVFNDSMSEDEINAYRNYLATMLTKDLSSAELVRTDVIDNAINNYLENRVTYHK